MNNTTACQELQALFSLFSKKFRCLSEERRDPSVKGPGAVGQTVSAAAVTAAVVISAATAVPTAVAAIAAPAAEENEDQDDPQAVIPVVPAHSQEPPCQDGDPCRSQFILCGRGGDVL